jgi:hypothetical protein
MKRTSSIPDLEAMIDRAIALKQKRHVRACELDAKAGEIYKSGDRLNFGAANGYRRDAEKLRRMELSTNKRIRRYSMRLAELRTGILPGIVTDESVRV